MTDKITIRLVVGFLGMIALAVVAGGFWLANGDKEIPAELIAVGSGAVGAVAALLARTSSEPSPAEQAHAIVANAPEALAPVAPLASSLGDDEHVALTEEELEEIGAVGEPKRGKRK